MGGAMSFSVAKGAFNMYLEERLNGASAADLQTMLNNLRNLGMAADQWNVIDDQPTWNALRARLPAADRVNVEPFEDALGTDYVGAEAPRAAEHIRHHWCATHTIEVPAIDRNGDPTVRPKPLTPVQAAAAAGDPSLATLPTTGWWHQWYGDAEEILREGLIRTIEAMLEINHNQNVADSTRPDPGKRIPVSVEWICGADRFESWVSKELGRGAQPPGAETIVLTHLTPGFVGGALSNDWSALTNKYIKAIDATEKSAVPAAALALVPAADRPNVGTIEPGAAGQRSHLGVGHGSNGVAYVYKGPNIVVDTFLKGIEQTSVGDFFVRNPVKGTMTDVLGPGDAAVVEPTFFEQGTW